MARPNTNRKTPQPNVRKALVGLGLLAGKNIRRAAIDAGFSPTTARNAKNNGLVVERCLADARQLWPEAVPKNLLELGRSRLYERLTSMVGSQMTVSEAAKLTDVLERSYGAGEGLDALSERRPTVGRMSILEQLALELAARKSAGRQCELLPEPQDIVLSPDDVVVEAEKPEIP